MVALCTTAWCLLELGSKGLTGNRMDGLEAVGT
jgi:hypothetical protein